MSIVLATLVAVTTVFGGLLPLYTRLREVEMRYLIGFASGVMISTAFFEILPEVEELTFENSLFLGLGFFALYALEKSILIHACGESECEIHNSIGWVSLIGIGAESLVDGLAIAVGFAESPLLGITIAVAVALHEIPRGFSTTVIMKNSNYSRRSVFGALAVDSLLTPLGALVGLFFPAGLFGPIIAFTAGTFIYVGASDLLPDAHRKFNTKVITSVLSGAMIIPLVVFFLAARQN